MYINHQINKDDVMKDYTTMNMVLVLYGFMVVVLILIAMMITLFGW